MYLLRCPDGHPISVSASAAGSEVTCPECGKPQAVPKLGELRQLPTAENATDSKPQAGSPFFARVLFAVLMLVALGAATAAAYGAFRWQSLPVPPTSADHIASDTKDIMALNPLEVLTIWDEYRKQDLAEQFPFDYAQMQELRDHWRSVCFISLTIAVVCVITAVVTILLGRTFTPKGHLG